MDRRGFAEQVPGNVLQQLDPRRQPPLQLRVVGERSRDLSASHGPEFRRQPAALHGNVPNW